jgi:hypothetical protein
MVLLVESASLAEAVIPTTVPTRGIFVDIVAGGVGVGDGTDIELVDIVDGNRERLDRYESHRTRWLAR